MQTVWWQISIIKKMPKEKALCKCKCSSIIMLDSVTRANKKYYPQTFLKKCKCVQEKIKIENHIDDDLKLDSDSNEETKSNIDTNDEWILKKCFNIIKS